MEWIAFSIIMFVIALLAGGFAAGSIGGDGKMLVFFIGYGVVTVIWLLLSAFFAVHIVDARNVGVVRTFGHISGQINEGFNLTFPWQSVEEYNIKLQVVEPETTCVNGAERCMDAGSIDVQDVYVQAALNMEVTPNNVQELARNIGQNYADTIVRNRMAQVTKAIISQYKAQDILAAREEIRAQIRVRMQAELAEYSINVVDFLLTNIEFTPTFKASIEEKVRTEQQALTERNRIEINRAQAEQLVETAKGQAEQARVAAQGEADRLRITAEGQAQANNILTQSITPTLIQWETVQRLIDNVQIMLVPSEGGLLLNVPALTNAP